MSEWKIYHNPKCTKSRQTLALLKENGVEPTIIEYLKDQPKEQELRSIIESLDAKASSLVRTKEDEYKNLKFDLNSTDTIVKNLAKYPKLIERPIVIRGNKAIIGRPPENVKQFFTTDYPGPNSSNSSS